ncbi:hypothetical protein SISNIDRAFT_460352 [Sistotremastrum niveocremeum HHB9708]|uniref:Transcription factor domain-containing protein n=2 Tax=Sistotremastraceae TaxID=3402574 RepID=A0A164NPR2_9AGAM|nr:hypothetical protein SISNIDRAFT_460352 [Sistotremastrum niveocremeum HHB9708]KZT31446.1 hypothetical protein SISSUDRAFT_1056499 [Sistotremastrum suecicum HHB10207 ss-3]
MSSFYQDFHIDHPYARTTWARPGHKPRNEELVTWPPPEMYYTLLERRGSQLCSSPSAEIDREKSEKTDSQPIKAIKDQIEKHSQKAPPEDPTSSSTAQDDPLTSDSTTNTIDNILPDEFAAEPQDEDGFYGSYLYENFSTVDLNASVYEETASETIPDFEELTDDEVSPSIALSEDNTTPGELDVEGDEQDYVYGQYEPAVDSASADPPDFSQAEFDSSSDSSSCYTSSSRRSSSSPSPRKSNTSLSLIQATSSTAPTEAQTNSPATSSNRKKQLFDERKAVLRACPWFAPGYDIDLEQLWMNLLSDRETELQVPSGELSLAAERFLNEDYLPELQGFDFVISVDRRKQLLGLCNLYPKERAGLSDTELDGTDGEKGLCFAALASLSSNMRLRRMQSAKVDLNAKLVQLSRGYLVRALATYDQTNLWDTELALGLVILGTVFAEGRAGGDPESRRVLRIIIGRAMSMSHAVCRRPMAARPLEGTQDSYIFFHVNLAAVIVDTYLEQPFRSLSVHPGELEDHQKALSDAFEEIPVSKRKKRKSQILFMIRRVEASLYHNYWKQTEDLDRKARPDFDAGFAKLQAMADKLGVQIPTPDF